MAASRPASTSARPKERVNPKVTFVDILTTFLRNKALAEELEFTNNGDRKKDIPGLRDRLLDLVKRHGEKDPESESYILALDEPVAYGLKYVTKVKAEARGGGKVLNVERAEELLAAKGDEDDEDYLDQCTKTRITWTDTMDNDRAIVVRKALDKLGVEYSDEVLLDEAELLSLHLVDGVLDEDELDTLYDKQDPEYALKPLA